MKGQFSRYGYNSRKRFSGLYNQQGRMITDSDLNEGHNILINKVNAVGDDVVKSGVPAVGGMVKIDTTTDPVTHTNTYTPALKEGDVYVDGIRGQFRERRKKGLRSLRGKLLALGADIVDIRGRLKGLNEAQIATHLFQLSIGQTTVDEIVDSLPPKEDNPTKDFVYFYNTQADFPSRPALSGNKLVYVDLWQRPIFWFEDDDLVDPGWNGADTAFRTRTMVQIKTAPPQTELGKDQFPQKGNAELASFFIQGTEEDDPCDPCAKELDITVRTGNKLVRLEVLDVEGDANQPNGVLLAWSDENASLAYPTDKPYPEGFEKSGAVYEFFSEVTESHLGVFEDEPARKRSHLEETLPGTTPNRTDIPGGGKWPFVRRWNGSVWIKFSYVAKDKINEVSFAEKSPAGNLVDLVPPLIGFSQTEETVKIEFGNVLLSLHIQVGGNPKEFVAGDYWLTLVRENATGVDRVNEITKRPMGITHHYLPLFVINNNFVPGNLDDAGQRRLSFPPLTNFPADHVSYDDHCAEHFESIGGKVENVHEALDRMCKLKAEHIWFAEQCPTPVEGEENHTFVGVKNVEEALLALCEREAKHIKFNEKCEGENKTLEGENETFEGVENVEQALLALCEREAKHVKFDNTCADTFGEATTVQEALTALCDVDCCDEHRRYLHDWGAVCGLKVHCLESQKPGLIIEPGAFVDQTGRLSVLKDPLVVSFNLDQMPVDQESFVPAIEYVPQQDSYQVKFLTKGQAKKLLGVTFDDKWLACRELYDKVFDFKGTPAPTKKSVTSISNVAKGGLVPKDGFVRSQVGLLNLEKFFDGTWERLEFLTTCNVKNFKPNFPKWKTGTKVLTKNQFKALNLNVYNAFIVLINAAYAAVRDCNCISFIPDCPVEGDENLVPLCEIKFNSRTQRVTEISNISCRKFCLTWRSFRYWLGTFLTNAQTFIAKELCEFKSLPARTTLGFPDPPRTTAETATTVIGGGVGIFKPGTNAGSISVGTNGVFVEKTPTTNLISFKGMTEEAATEAAKNFGITINQAVPTENLTSGQEKEAFKFNVSVGELLRRGDIAFGGDTINLFVKDGRVASAVLVDAVPPEERTVVRRPGGMAAASPDLVGTNAIKELEKENIALKKELGDMRVEMAEALVEMRNAQPMTSVVFDRKKNAVLTDQKIFTIGDLKALSSNKRKVILKKAGLTRTELGKVNTLVKKSAVKKEPGR